MAGSKELPRLQAILLPGGVLPAEPAYKNLLTELSSDADAHTKDLEVYATDSPPPDYSIDTEVGGIARVADQLGFDRFHLVGYSCGRASSLAFTAAYPDRVLSLALLEPAWAGNDGLRPEEQELRRAFRSWRVFHPEPGANQAVVEEMFAESGALVFGRRTYDITDSWGVRHPINGMPVFVLTHQPPPPESVPQGSSNLTFVTNGIVSAIRQANAAAGDVRPGAPRYLLQVKDAVKTCGSSCDTV